MKGSRCAGFPGQEHWWVVSMSKNANIKPVQDQDLEPAVEAIKRMIRYTQKEADKDGRTFCSYFLDMALQSLEDGSEDLDTILKTKVTPLMINKASAGSSNMDA